MTLIYIPVKMRRGYRRLRSSRTLNILNPQHPRPSTIDPRPSTLNPQFQILSRRDMPSTLHPTNSIICDNQTASQFLTPASVLVLLLRRRCEHPGCTKSPSFGLASDGLARTCSKHKARDHVQVGKPKVTNTKSPSKANYEFDKRSRFDGFQAQHTFRFVLL